MLKSNILEQVNEQVSKALGNSPFTDVEKNLKSIIIAILNKLDIVTREEFDIQQKVLAATREKLEKLEKQLEELKQEA
ncbi:MAG: phosphoheptose isomerase [Burkholderiales bacterium]|jgi:BMFP domain-containing protein YqiC|nr:phosphoheptose isomerase [Burkholderiales bacterium]